MTRSQVIILWAILVLYACGHISHLLAGSIPAIVIVLLQVVPPAVFAWMHGKILYGPTAIIIFSVCCCGTAAVFESISLRTGFPFGHYYFTGLMGPKLFQLPVLLVLAYLGIGYASWILAVLILDYGKKELSGVRILALPVLAAFIMTAWDLSMEANWAGLDHAWVWLNGGAFFGVPISNFFGWYLTTFTQYLLFAFYRRANPKPTPHLPDGFWITAIVLYLICAGGNLVVPFGPPAPPVVTDASGHAWLSKDILAMVVLMSGLVMLPAPALAWLRLKDSTCPVSSPSPSHSDCSAMSPKPQSSNYPD